MNTTITIKLADLQRAISLREGRGFAIELEASDGHDEPGAPPGILTATLRRERAGLSLVNIDRKEREEPAPAPAPPPAPAAKAAKGQPAQQFARRA
jgi:hypothetical protein